MVAISIICWVKCCFAPRLMTSPSKTMRACHYDVMFTFANRLFLVANVVSILTILSIQMELFEENWLYLHSIQLPKFCTMNIGVTN